MKYQLHKVAKPLGNSEGLGEPPRPVVGPRWRPDIDPREKGNEHLFSEDDRQAFYNANLPSKDLNEFKNATKREQAIINKRSWSRGLFNLLSPVLGSSPVGALLPVFDPVHGVPAMLAGAGAGYGVQATGAPSELAIGANIGATLGTYKALDKLLPNLPGWYTKYSGTALNTAGKPGVLMPMSLLNKEVWDGTYNPYLYIKQTQDVARNRQQYPNPSIANPLAFANVLVDQAVDTGSTYKGGLQGLLFSRGGGTPTIATTGNLLTQVNDDPARDDIWTDVWKGWKRYGLLNYGMNNPQGEANERLAKNAIIRGSAYNPSVSPQENAQLMGILSVYPEGDTTNMHQVINNNVLDYDKRIKQALDADDMKQAKELHSQALNKIYGTSDPDEISILHRVMYQSPRAQRPLDVKLSPADKKSIAHIAKQLNYALIHGDITREQYAKFSNAVKGTLKSGRRPATRHERARAIRARIYELGVKTGLSYPIAALAFESGIDLQDRAIHDEEFSSIEPLKTMDRFYRAYKRKGMPFPWRQYQLKEVNQANRDSLYAKKHKAYEANEIKKEQTWRRQYINDVSKLVSDDRNAVMGAYDSF